jgi:hypothetical protein
MTVTVDAKKRIVLPGGEPGDRFDVTRLDSERVLIVRLLPADSKPNRVRFEKRGRFTVGVVDAAPVAREVIAEALEEFP